MRSVWIALLAAGCSSTRPDSDSQAESRLRDAQQALEAARKHEAARTGTQRDVVNAEAELQLRQLDLQETRQSGRDFTLERYRVQAARAQRIEDIARREAARWQAQYQEGSVTELRWLPFDGESEVARVQSNRWSRLVKLRHAARAPSDTEAQAFWIHYEANLEISEIVVRTRKRMLDVCARLYAAGTIDRDTLDAADRAHHTAQTARHEARMGRQALFEDSRVGPRASED